VLPRPAIAPSPATLKDNRLNEAMTLRASLPEGRELSRLHFQVNHLLLTLRFRSALMGVGRAGGQTILQSVDYVLFSDSAVRAATNNQQWYVTISRGKKGIHIFTCDKEALRDNITRSGDRPLALDAVAGKRDSRTVAVRQIQELLRERAKRREAETRRVSQSRGMSI
jgi:hypothetical protein